MRRLIKYLTLLLLPSALITIFSASFSSFLISRLQSFSQFSNSVQVLAQTPSECSASDTANWCQIGRDAQRSGYTPEILGTNISKAWTHPFQPDKIFPQVQAIIYRNKVFVGTEGANGQVASIYALDAQNGNEQWVYPVGSPVLASVATYEDKVFFAAMNGTIYALDEASGAEIWKTQLSKRLGFSTAPVIADNKIMLGGRDGKFYALDFNGKLIWQHDIHSPILQTAAYNNNKVYFGAMNMHVYAINTTDGTQAWESAKVQGMAFKDYWPVLYQNMVYIRPMGRGSLGVQDNSMVTDATAQQSVLSAYDANPENFEFTLRRFHEDTGIEAPATINYPFQTMNGATSPPCVDKDGYLIIPAPSTTGYQTGWGRLDVNTRILVDILYDGTDIGYGNMDENMNLTCTGDSVFTMHTQEMNAHDTAVFNLNKDNWSWTQIAMGQTSQQMSHNAQGGGGNPASISNGYIYHISFHELIARTTTP